MCGTEEPRLKPVVIEGTRLLVCARCARFGTEVQEPKPRRPQTPPARAGRRPVAPAPREEVEYDLALDYPDRIRRGREGRGWKREDLARQINEKLSVIEKLEKGKMRPDDALVSRLERALGVRLMERVEEEVPPSPRDTRPLTLGDLIRREE